MRRALLCGGLAAALLTACDPRDRGAGPTPGAADPLAPLHDFEESRRKETVFDKLPASDEALGPDPYVVRMLPGEGPARYVALHRGRGALVLLDAALHEIARVAVPPSPSGLAVSAEGEIFVAAELSPRITRFRVEGAALLPAAPLVLPDALALRDLALGPERVLYAVEAHDGRLISIPLDHPERQASLRVGDGAFRVARAGAWVIVDCLLEHSLSLIPVDAAGLPTGAGVVRIQHDGPLWGFDAMERGGTLWIVAGGVEDHPLDRRGGSFGFIDSFVFLYRLDKGATTAERVSTINASAEGVVTPKALLFQREGAELAAWVTGYGSDRLLDLRWPDKAPASPQMSTRRGLPGINALILDREKKLIGADPLFDAFVRIDPHGPAEAEPAMVPALDPSTPVHPPSPTPVARLGETLFFTTLMAPWNSSEGPLSRFTCETCHFEGQVDGRTHHTGRGEIHATTKPLVGLFNNRPHFSRALDPDLTTVADAEFRVAGALSNHDPWFSATPAEAAWLPRLGLPESALTPVELRRALMTFLMSFTHRPNPAAHGRTGFTDLEKEGLALFAKRCEGCHAARVVSDDPASRLSEEYWETVVFSREGPIVWASSEYRKTGVEPYVHERGARTPSLRRLFAKRPYFTSGAAKDLAAVLSRVRFAEGASGVAPFFHDAAPPGEAPLALSESEQRALLAFLDLL
jgi:hypothetical protein